MGLAQKQRIIMPLASKAEHRLFLALLLNFVVFGMTVTMVGATAPKIIRQFSWSYLATGLVISASPIGYFISAFVSGMLVERFGPKGVLLCGLLFQSTGLGLFGVLPSVAPNLSMSLMIGLGQGATEVVTNSCVARVERPGKSRLMNAMHAAFTVGAIVGPVLIGWMMAAGHSWQGVYRGVAILSLAIAGAFLFLPFESLGRPGTLASGSLAARPLLGLFFVAMLLFTGAELGVSAWLSEYFVQALRYSVAIGAWMVSVFWLGVLFGRLAFSAFQGTPNQVQSTFMLGCWSTASLALSLLAGRGLAPFFFFLTGLGFSAVYPLLVSSVGHRFPESQASAIGTVVSGGGIGSLSFPLIMAAISGQWGIASAHWFCVMAAGSATMVAWTIQRKAHSIPPES